MWVSPASRARRNSAHTASRSASRCCAANCFRVVPPSRLLNSASSSRPQPALRPNLGPNVSPVWGLPMSRARRTSAQTSSKFIGCLSAFDRGARSPAPRTSASPPGTAADGPASAPPTLHDCSAVSGSNDHDPRSAASSAASRSNPQVMGISGDSAVMPRP